MEKSNAIASLAALSHDSRLDMVRLPVRAGHDAAAGGLPVTLYESGECGRAHVRGWGHVRLFSLGRLNTDHAAAALLHEHGWHAPPGDSLPTGHDLCWAYLAPLAQTPLLRSVIET